jgi:hypothetical protein
MINQILGFELENEGKFVFGGFNECSITLIFTKNPQGRERDLEVSFSGLYLDSDESGEWLNKEMKLGDKYVIKVKESSTISPFRVKEKPQPYQEVLGKMSEEELLQMKLKHFLFLEKKLKSKGLI